MDLRSSGLAASYFYPVSFANHYRYSHPEPKHQLVEFLTAPKALDSCFKEAILACQIVYETTKEPLNICLSGGLDSECLVQAAIASKVPFKVSIFKYLPDFNVHDIRFAIEFCEAKKINYELVELDIVRFYETGEYLEFALKYQVNSPQFVVYLKCASQTSGNTIFAGGFPYINYFIDGKKLETPSIFTPSSKEYCFDRFFNVEKRTGVGHFFQYTPELYFSFLLKTIAGGSIGERSVFNFENHYAFKAKVYEQGGFNVSNCLERKVKFNGFEKLKDYYADRYGVGDIYEKLFRLPLQEIMPPEESIITLYPNQVVEQLNLNWAGSQNVSNLQ